MCMTSRRKSTPLLTTSDETGTSDYTFKELCVCVYSVTKLCLTLCDPRDCSPPRFPVLHYLLDFAQIHVHWVSDAI